MREYVILGCVVGLAACGGSKGAAKQDSLPRDSTNVPGPPAVTVTPSSESIASRQRTPTTGKTGTDARKPPNSGATGGTGTKTTPVPPPPSKEDTVRGIVSNVGTARDHRVVVAPRDGGRRVEITGPLAILVGHAAGADVWVAGVGSGTSIQAARFVVKTVDGAPAIDGTLRTEGGSLFIVTADGTRTRIAAPPPPLVGRDGARVWITGDPSKAVASYGFIDPPR
jgi:hypothetical protein